MCRVCLDAGSEGIAEVSTTGVVVAPGAVVTKAVGGQEASEGPLGDLPDDPAPLVVVEPEWEDGAAVAQVRRCHCSTSPVGLFYLTSNKYSSQMSNTSI